MTFLLFYRMFESQTENGGQAGFENLVCCQLILMNVVKSQPYNLTKLQKLLTNGTSPPFAGFPLSQPAHSHFLQCFLPSNMSPQGNYITMTLFTKTASLLQYYTRTNHLLHFL